MTGKELAVLLYGRQVATVRQTEGGQHTLEYVADPGRTPVSVSMPLSRRRHSHRSVEPFLEGLLPDNDDTRAAMGREFGVSGRNPFSLLGRMGLDCAGAVQFCDPAQSDEVLARSGELRLVDDVEIGQRIADLADVSGVSWVLPSERWSLAGAQSKFALHWTGSGWAQALGATPTTHIIKPGIRSLASQALNEHVCMRTAARCGLPVADSTYTEFDGHAAIVVKRYDRLVGSDGSVLRVHQEDLCQAMAVPPSRKYEADGGPSAAKVFHLLRSERVAHGESEFMSALIFNYLIGGSDAHAKNFSILLVAGDAQFAPMYDVASAFPYDLPQRFGAARSRRPEMSFSIGGARRFGGVGPENWAKLARLADIDPDAALGSVRDLAGRLPDALRDAFAEVASVAGAAELENRMLPEVDRACRAALDG